MAKKNPLGKSMDYKGLKQDLKKEVREYMKLPYTIKLIPEEDGTYYVAVDELPGCASMGDTVEEALKMIKDAMEGWLESSIDRGLEIPLPDVMREYSGRFLVRVPVSLHRKLVAAAHREGVSLNQYVVSILSENYSIRNVENLLKSINKSVQIVQSQVYISKEKIITTEWGEEHERNKQYIQ